MNNIQVFAFADEANADFDAQIKAMQRNGLDGIEIRNVGDKNVTDLTVEEAKEVRRKMDDAGLITWSIGSPLGKINIETGDFFAHLEKFKHALEIADILNAENIRLFSFFMPKEKDPADFRNEVIDRLGKFVDLAADCGIALCHENEKGIYGDNAARCLDVLNAVPQLCGVFDPANFVQCGQDTLKAWELLKDRIKYMHIKDAFADGSVVPAGKGDGNVAAIVREFIVRGGKQFTIEPHLKVFKGLAELEQEGEQSKVGETFVFESNEAAFDAACEAFKALL